MLKPSGQLVELWQIFKDGKDGEIYEVVECAIPSYLGKRVKVSVTTEESTGATFKCLVDFVGEDRSAESELLTVLYGCLGTAKYSLVGEYEAIPFHLAYKHMQKGDKSVYVMSKDEILYRISLNSELKIHSIYSITDLFTGTYYVRKEVDSQ